MTQAIIWKIDNHLQSTIKVNNDYEKIVGACSEATKAQSEDTFEFKRPYPPPLEKLTADSEVWWIGQ